MKHATNLTNNQQGSAMVISILALMALTMIGTLMMARTQTETQITGHAMRDTQAFFNAEAGYGEVLARMSDSSDTTYYMGAAVNGWQTNPGWGRYVVLAGGNAADDPELALTASDGLDNDGDGTADETNESYPEVATAQAADAINYPWVKVHYKLNGTSQVVLFGDHDNDVTTPAVENLTTGLPVIVVTATGGQGTATRTVRVEAVKAPFEVPNAAIYATDDDFKFNGTQFLVSGQDWDPVLGIPTANPAVDGISTGSDPNNITGEVSAMQQNNIEGTGGTPSVAASDVSVDLNAMADAYSALADNVLAPGTYSGVSFGDLDHYEVTHCTGDFKISGNLTGGGILIVDGDFECTGSFTWYGLVIVRGDMKFSGGGSSIHIYGATLVDGNGTGGHDISGNADIMYSSMALSRLSNLAPYMVSSWQEID